MFVVDSTDNLGDENTGDGICKADNAGSDNCTLRAAIEEANANPGADTITFAIPGPGPHVISASSNYEDTADITIDGTTQPGYAGTRIVEVRGPGDADSQAIFGAGDNVTIKGLSITNWGAAVTLLGSGGVQDSWLGVEPGGALRANLNVGVVLEGTGASVVRSRIAGGRCGIFITASLNGGCGITPGDVQAASGNTIGGDASTGAGNTIYGFTVAGVFVSGAGAGNTIQGNVIGLTPAGTPSGGGNGVFIRDALGTVVGANAGPGDLYILNPNLGNVVAGITTEGNRGIAVLGTSSGTRIAANSVGTDRAGTATGLGVGGQGIVVSGASGIQIGPGNKVAYNRGAGVQVVDGTGNRIVANAIHDNNGDGIELVDANNGLPAPTLTDAVVDGSLTTFSGSIDVPAAGTYFVELFSSPLCDPSGFGEGKTYLTFVTVSPDGAGSASFTAQVTGLPANEVYSATLTRADSNDTSAFSNCFETDVAPPPLVTGLTITGLPTVDAGAGTVPLAGIPPAALVVPQTRAHRLHP